MQVISQLRKDLVGIDLAEIVTGRATGTAIGRSLRENAPGGKAPTRNRALAAE